MTPPALLELLTGRPALSYTAADGWRIELVDDRLAAMLIRDDADLVDELTTDLRAVDVDERRQRHARVLAAKFPRVVINPPAPTPYDDGEPGETPAQRLEVLERALYRTPPTSSARAS